MKNKGKVMTVLGPKDPKDLGVILPHEHLYFDLTGYRSEMETPEDTAFFYEPMTIKNLFRIKNHPYGNRENCINLDREWTLREMAKFKVAGGSTFCDVCPGGVDEGVMEYYMPILVDLSKSSGMNVVAGFGHYVAFTKDKGESPITFGVRDPAYYEMSIEEVAKRYIKAIEDGFGDTGVRPGLIGELGTGLYIEDIEAKTLRAAGLAQVETGLTITLHMHSAARNGQEAIDLITEMGVRPEKIVIGHCDSQLCQTGGTFEEGMDYIFGLLDRGSYIEFDLCGNNEYFKTDQAHFWLPTDRERAAAIKKLCEAGYGDKILLSHDTGHRYYMSEYGGWAWSHVICNFRRTLREAGISEDAIIKLSTENPQRMLTIG